MRIRMLSFRPKVLYHPRGVVFFRCLRFFRGAFAVLLLVGEVTPSHNVSNTTACADARPARPPNTRGVSCNAAWCGPMSVNSYSRSQIHTRLNHRR